MPPVSSIRLARSSSAPKLAAEDDEGLAAALRTQPVGVARTHEQVVEAVAVHVADPRHRPAEAVAIGRPAHDEAVAAVEIAEAEAGGEALVGAEDHVGGTIRPEIRPGCRVGADDDVGEAVAVQVAGPGEAEPGKAVLVGPLDDEAVAAVEIGRIEARLARPGPAEDDIGLARLGEPVRARVLAADGDVGEAVAVDVAEHGDAAARLVEHGAALDAEPVLAVERRKLDPLAEPAGLAAHDIAQPAIVAAYSASPSRAPMTMSAKPSPSMSPPPATLIPVSSPAAVPASTVGRSAAAWSAAARSMTGLPSSTAP
ncbi:MAG: hypothetical protein R3D25_05685 [Geminicoccaceae bacterium]